jgi:hypothetical protein
MLMFLWHIHEIPFSVKHVHVQDLCLATNTWAIEDKSSYLCPIISDCFCLTRVCYLLTYIWCSREVHRSTFNYSTTASPLLFQRFSCWSCPVFPSNFPFLFKSLCCFCNQSFLQRPDIAWEPDFAGNFQ